MKKCEFERGIVDMRQIKGKKTKTKKTVTAMLYETLYWYSLCPLVSPFRILR